MKQFPELNTDRLHLRKMDRLSDSEALYSYFSKDIVMQYYDLETFTDISQAVNLIDLWNKRFDEDKGMRWAITLKGENKLIGTCGFHNISKENSRAEIGYEVSPDYWGKGIATEAIKSILEYGFNVLKYHRIEAFIDPENTASEKVLLKNDLLAEGILHDYFFEKGKYVDAKIFAHINKAI